MKKILFVCLGNICRSPAAQAIFSQKTREAGYNFTADSAGTGEWHVGRPPDKRMQQAARLRGLDLSQLRARQIDHADFYEFDYILAMDLTNQADILSIAPANRHCDIRLLLDFGSGTEREVPDPYYGSGDGFAHVLDLLDDACEGLLLHLENEDH